MRTQRNPQAIRAVERARVALLREQRKLGAYVTALEDACLSAAHGGYSVREIARMTQWSPSTVSRALRSAEQRQGIAA